MTGNTSGDSERHSEGRRGKGGKSGNGKTDKQTDIKKRKTVAAATKYTR